MLGASCVQELENIIPKVRKQNISRNALILYFNFISLYQHANHPTIHISDLWLQFFSCSSQRLNFFGKY